MLIDHMAQGYSFTDFAATNDISRDTLNEWCHVHKAFSDARKIAFEKCQAWWERQAKNGLVSNKEGSLNPAIWIYNMKCRFPKEWRDVQQHHVVTQNLDKIPDEKLLEEMKKTVSIIEAEIIKDDHVKAEIPPSDE